MDYKEFSFHVFGLNEKPKLDTTAKNIVEKVKAVILARGGVSGIHGVTRTLKRMDTDRSNNLDKNELLSGLRDYGLTDISPKDMTTLFK